VADALEREAFERAKNKSDVLIIFLLKGLKSSVYHDRVESSVTHNQSVNDPGRSKLSDKELDTLIQHAQELRLKRKQAKIPGPVIEKAKQNTGNTVQ